MVKNVSPNAGDVGSIPGLGRSLGGGNGNPLQYSYLGNPLSQSFIISGLEVILKIRQLSELFDTFCSGDSHRRDE